MKMKNVRKSIVPETEYGVYVWFTADKRMIQDDEGRPLAMPARRGDVKAINAMRDAAYGFLGDMGLEKNGNVAFFPGHRLITDDEYDEQRMRMEFGLTPDPYDVPAITEELEYNKRFNLK